MNVRVNDPSVKSGSYLWKFKGGPTISARKNKWEKLYLQGLQLRPYKNCKQKNIINFTWKFCIAKKIFIFFSIHQIKVWEMGFFNNLKRLLEDKSSYLKGTDRYWLLNTGFSIDLKQED